MVAGAADDSSTLWGKLEDRVSALRFASSNLGESIDGPIPSTTLIQAMVVFALIFALVGGRWRQSGFALPAAMLVSGLVVQAVLDQGYRRDVLTIWDVPLYALAAWTLVQAVGLTRKALVNRPAGTIVGVGVIALVLAVGTVDRMDAIDTVAPNERLGATWRAARSGEPVEYNAAIHPRRWANRHYLPCDPPYGWG